jgi:small-conductance mechanosensitive channel
MLERFLHWKVGGIEISLILIAAIVAAVIFAGLLLVRRLLRVRVAAWAARSTIDLVDLMVELIVSTKGFVLLVVAVYAGLLVLPLSARWLMTLGAVATTVFLVQIGLWGNRIVGFSIRRLVERHAQEDGGLANAAGALSFLSRVVLWSLVALLVLSSLKINITALVAGLGVGGVAVALALQNILGDLFASLSILIDKPFAVGHFIVVDDLAGTVEHVGIKSTRVRSLSGEEIVLSNGDLLKCRIHNYKKLLERRVLFSFGVTYDTPHEKLAALGAMMRTIIEAVAKTRFDRAHFKEFGDSSLNFEVVYFVLDPDYNCYMDIQQQINLAMVHRFAEEKIEFAFPTRTLYLMSAAPAASLPANGKNSSQSGEASHPGNGGGEHPTE